jgi:hypothetical protein
MGMYFNTPATTFLLQTLNARYGTSGTGLSAHRGDSGAYSNAALSLKQIWLTFGVSLNVSGSPNGEANWEAWLDGIVNIDNGLDTVQNAIKKAMVYYLGDQNCIAIEFFAVPSKQILAHFPPHVPDPSTGKYSYVITVETVTYDKVASFVRETRTRAHHRE